MKKTLTVNLGGTVFHIDEDAYILLDNYLNNLRYHFRNEEDSDEIVRDMEMRISELFAESMEGGQQVITIDNVEAVIARMGRPEQMDDHIDSGAEDKDSNESDEKSEESRNHSFYQEQEVKKRLFRDMDNRILGGVVAGIAAYLGWDRTALRLILIVLGFFPGGFSILIIYLVMQFIVPPARTATEKLQMRGEPVNMENIGKTVTDGFERENKPSEENEHRTGMQKFLDVVVKICGLLIKVILILALICCAPLLFVAVIVLFSILLTALGVFVHLPSFCWNLLPGVAWDVIGSSPVPGLFFMISFFLLICIPILGFLQMVFNNLGYWKPMSVGVKIGLLVLWFVALIGCFITFSILNV